MNAVALGSPLIKLLRATRGDPSAIKGPSHHALRLAIARAGREALNTDLLAEEVSHEQVNEAESLIDPLDGFALVGKLASNGIDAGIFAVDASGIAAITSLRTTGHLPTTVPDRKASTVETALAHPLVTGVILAWSAALSEDKDADARLIHGYRAAGRASSARALAMAMPQGPLNVYRVDVEFGGSAKGKLVFAFPTERLGKGKLKGEEKSDTDSARWTKQFGDELLEAPTRIDAVLLRRPIAVAELRGLKPGQLLPVPKSALEDVVLLGTAGAVIGKAKLGQLSGYRAVRLREGRKADGPADAASEDSFEDAQASMQAPMQEPAQEEVAMDMELAMVPDEEPAMISDDAMPMALDL